MLSNTNMVVISGKLTRDTEMRYTPSGKAVAQIAVAINESYEKDGQKKESVTYVDCTAWEAMAEKAAPMKQGDSVIVVGKLRKDSWEDKKTQEKRYKTYVLAEAITNPFGGGKRKAAASPAPAAQPAGIPADEEIPFAFIPPWLPFAASAAFGLVA